MADILANPDEINKPADDESWTERESDASVENPPTYPHNKVMMTESGHLFEMDDTLGRERIRLQHGGAKNAGKAIILYSDGKELAPDIDTLDATNIDQRLLQVSEQIVQQIITAHRCHPQLLGIQTPGKLGYSTELLQSWEIFDKMVIRPERKLILDAFKQILIYNGVPRVEIETLVPIKIIEQA